MRCPRTNEELVKVKLAGSAVDLSEACGGVFFDAFELAQFDTGEDYRGEVLVEHLRQFETYVVDNRSKLHCPKCVDAIMFRRFYSPLRKFEIDECRQCGGAWLDFNDLEGIRQLFSSNEERQRLSEEFSNSVLNDPHLQVLKTEEEHQIGRMNYLAGVLRGVARIFGKSYF